MLPSYFLCYSSCVSPVLRQNLLHFNVSYFLEILTWFVAKFYIGTFMYQFFQFIVYIIYFFFKLKHHTLLDYENIIVNINLPLVYIILKIPINSEKWQIDTIREMLRWQKLCRGSQSSPLFQTELPKNHLYRICAHMWKL